ncbi:protein kinase [Kribbella sp. NBC_01245]|uniref:protein kinase domain-containing protein n=1 Tax=Kribbella sp. NBC_01245 TaxID=2903578 RepID=UPI002E2E3E60|nr:protein kinase [Kribbella sp. NBC_01245]
MEEFAGFSVRRTLGAGSIGTVQLVRDHATGRFVVVKRVPVERVPSEHAFRQRLAPGFSHPHVARQLDVRRTEHEWFVLTEYYPAGSLADLLARRGRLAVAELVTLLVPIAQALAAAHQIGLHHCHLGAGDILFTADGRPILTDLGLHSYEGSGAEADLNALRDLALLAGGSPTTFTPALFTDAPSLAGCLLALSEPAPIDLAFEAPTASDVQPAWGREVRPIGGLAKSRAAGVPQARRRKPKVGRRLPALPRPDARVVLLGLAALFATALLITGVLLIGHSGGSSAAAEAPATSPPLAQPPSPGAAPSFSNTPARTTTGPPVARGGGARTVADWLAMLRALDRQRAISFATLDFSALDAIYVRGSRPWLADRSMLAAYRRSGLTVQGLSMKIEGVAIERQAATTAVLRVIDHLAGGVLKDTAGHRTLLPTGQPTTRLITLTQQGTQWRINNITTV